MIAYECTLPVNSNSNVWRMLVDMAQGIQSEPKPTIRKLALGFTSPALESGVFAMSMMAIVPAHLMRSVGGGYDNESVAVTAMNLTFYFWVRSLRGSDPYSWMYGFAAGLAYFYMVASWGGYIFVINMVGVHAGVLVLMGRFSDKVWASYSVFYSVGTALAIQIPVVGWAPLKSLEQLGPCAVFLGYQILQLCEVIRRKRGLSRLETWKLRVQISSAGVVLGIAAIWILTPSGYFGPLSSRVRGLFVQHTKTGNPLVDSVAEHQPASSKAYFQYLHHVCSVAPIGYIMVMCNLSDSSSFLLAWGAAAYFFSHKMVRLVLLTAPIGSSLGGIAVGRIFAWCIRQIWDASSEDDKEVDIPKASPVEPNGVVTAKDKKAKKPKKVHATASSTSSFDGLKILQAAVDTFFKSKEGITVKRIVALTTLVIFYVGGVHFKNYCWRLSKDLSHPSIIQRARLRDGRIVNIDDYREAYWWLRDNTPKDSRIMAWWDYGYQITAIANRTTLADGNTWNHEHIALLGKALTTDLDEGYEIARHLADYVLVWGGGGGDDLAKSPHLARIANSVYREHCPGDPTCRAFGFIDHQGTPSPMMERSFLYRLHGHAIKPGVEVPPEKFQEVYRSKYGKVRVFKILGVSEESKNWVADPANKLCDAPGSWFCPGQYPPGLNFFLSRKKDFAQLEDFNKGTESDSEYQKQYFENLNNPEYSRQMRQNAEALQKAKSEKKKPPMKARTYEISGAGISTELPNKESAGDGKAEGSVVSDEKQIEEVYNTYEDTEETTIMWQLISAGKVEEIRSWIESTPAAAYIRSKDGRGPMWWAFESRNQEIVKILTKAGVPHTDKDVNGKSPVDLLEGQDQ